MSGRGMSFILYVVVLVVSVTSVTMGLDWLSTPPPPLPKSVQTVSVPAKPAAPPVSEKTALNEAAPAQAANTVGKTNAKTDLPAVAKADVAPSAPAKSNATDAMAVPETADAAPADAGGHAQAATSDNMPNIVANEGDMNGDAAQANAPAPRCDVQACTARYHSFNASDCTYQPFDGPRRLCTVGNPPKQASDTPAGVQTSDASTPPAPSSCNVQACAAAYQSFDAATCTWQPFEGPRRLCEK